MGVRIWIKRVNKFEELTLTLTLLGLAGIGTVQVFCRYVLEFSFDWFEELGRYMGVLVTFLGASLGVKYGAHFSMDMIVTSLKRPWKNLLESTTNLICAACFITIAYYGFRLVIKNYGYETTSPTMQLPMYLVYLPIPFFSIFIALRFFINTSKCLKNIIVPDADAGTVLKEAE